MAKKFFLTLLICLILLPLISAELQVGISSNGGEGIGINFITPIPPTNFSTVNVNFSDFSNLANFAFVWVTDEGNMNNVPDLYPTLDGRYLELDGSNFFTDSLIDYDNSLFNFSINTEVLDTTINLLGYNHTSNLTAFYDLRYLTGQLSLFFYNDTSLTNSSYTIMNSTIPTGLEQRDSFPALSNGDNLLTKRLLDEINLTILEQGAYNQHTTIDYVSGTKDVNMRSELYILYENGSEMLIGQSPPSIGLLVGIYQQVIWTGAITEDVIFPEGSHLTMYLYATVSGVGQAPTIDLVVADETASRLDIGINPTDIKIDEVDPFALYKDGSKAMTGNLDMDVNGITNVATLDNGGSDIVVNDNIDLGSNFLSTSFGIISSLFQTFNFEQELRFQVGIWDEGQEDNTVGLLIESDGSSLADTTKITMKRFPFFDFDIGTSTSPMTNLHIENIDLGTNTITDGVMTGDWDFNGGSLETTGNIIADKYFGDGSELTGLPQLADNQTWIGNNNYTGNVTFNGEGKLSIAEIEVSTFENILYFETLEKCSIPDGELGGMNLTSGYVSRTGTNTGWFQGCSTSSGSSVFRLGVNGDSSSNFKISGSGALVSVSIITGSTFSAFNGGLTSTSGLLTCSGVSCTQDAQWFNPTGTIWILKRDTSSERYKEDIRDNFWETSWVYDLNYRLYKNKLSLQLEEEAKYKEKNPEFVDNGFGIMIENENYVESFNKNRGDFLGLIAEEVYEINKNASTIYQGEIDSISKDFIQNAFNVEQQKMFIRVNELEIENNKIKQCAKDNPEIFKDYATCINTIG